MQSLKELIANAGFVLSEEEVEKEEKELKDKHRGKTVMERPKEEIVLKSIAREPFIRKKVQLDPTPDLVTLVTVSEDDNKATGYLVICELTREAWYAPTKECLDANFIYRDDLEIYELNEKTNLAATWRAAGCSDWNQGIISSKFCYILDNVSNETYEVYSDPNYPAMKYGKSTPSGMFVHKYENRFHRDMAILELDQIYDEASKKRAVEMVKRELKSNEAIIITDGCWQREVCASSYWYLDNTEIIHLTSGKIPSEPDQAVLISEISGATLALQMCQARYKKKITYYYDNTSILNVFRNRKTEYIKEVVDYKELLEKLNDSGYSINFVELHPKTGENRDTENKALMYFHNDCDRSCRDMTSIFRKDYRSFACCGNTDGKTYTQVKEEYKPKGKPGNSKPYKPGTNYNPRKH